MLNYTLNKSTIINEQMCINLNYLGILIISYLYYVRRILYECIWQYCTMSPNCQRRPYEYCSRIYYIIIYYYTILFEYRFLYILYYVLLLHEAHWSHYVCHPTHSSSIVTDVQSYVYYSSIRYRVSVRCIILLLTIITIAAGYI